MPGSDPPIDISAKGLLRNTLSKVLLGGAATRGSRSCFYTARRPCNVAVFETTKSVLPTTLAKLVPLWDICLHMGQI